MFDEALMDSRDAEDAVGRAVTIPFKNEHASWQTILTSDISGFEPLPGPMESPFHASTST